MNTRVIMRTGLAVLTLLILTTSAALAWPDQPPDRATLSGPGLTGEVEITGKENLGALQLGVFEDFSHGPIAAPNVGEGYRITRYFYEASFNFGVLHYYPDPSGGRGYVFFEDGPDLSGNHTAYDGQWFYATPEGDAAMQRILAQVAAPAPSPTGSAAPARAPAPTLALLGALTAVLLIVWAVQRRAARPHPAESSAD